jgi:hypothetical protein
LDDEDAFYAARALADEFEVNFDYDESMNEQVALNNNRTTGRGSHLTKPSWMT